MDVDIYVLAKDRNAATARRFLNEFLPKRIFNDGVYELYGLDGTEEVNFKCVSEKEMLERLEEKETVEVNCSFYPINEPKLIRSAHLYYLVDGGMICALNLSQVDDKKEDTLLIELRNFLESNYGFISYHQPPPITKIDFINIVDRIEG